MPKRSQCKTIVIGCQEICGWIALLSSEFRKAGYRVISISPGTKYYNDQSYTLNKDHFALDYFILRIRSNIIGKLTHLIYTVLRKLFLSLLNKDLSNRLRVHANNYLYQQADIYIHIWEGLESSDADLYKFKIRGTKIVSWFVGDEVRFYPTILKEFNIDNNYFLEYNKHVIYTPLRKLRMHERFSDVIFSVPDQSSLALRPYHHLQIPLDLTKYRYKNTGNDIPIIIHIPSAPLLKGSPVFESVVKELSEEGLQFQFKNINNIPNSEVRKLLTEADILLDELYMHGPGMLGMEAMASGCCVMVKYLETSPGCFKPPVVSITSDNLKSKLRELIQNKSLREELIKKGRSYVEKNNNAKNVCNLILNSINSYNYDYYPNYFREKFELEEHYNLLKINELTAIVKDCKWYNKYVPKGSRNGLVF